MAEPTNQLPSPAKLAFAIMPLTDILFFAHYPAIFINKWQFISVIIHVFQDGIQIIQVSHINMSSITL